MTSTKATKYKSLLDDYDTEDDVDKSKAPNKPKIIKISETANTIFAFPQGPVCYLLSSTIINRSYVGYTVNLTRRIRQHNGEIKGGAKGTHYGRPWEIVGYISGFPDRTTALQFEWAIKHCRKGGWGVKGRIAAIEIILEKERATSKAVENKELRLTMNWLNSEYEFDSKHKICKENMLCAL